MSHYSSTFFSSDPTGFNHSFCFNHPKSIDYGNQYYYNYPQNPAYQSAVSYSVVADPNLVEYRGGDPQLVVAYAASQWTEPDDVEYNPVPYGGGYDLAVTYGEPLPPSDEICHPRSLPNPTPRNGSVDSPQKKAPQMAQQDAAPPEPIPREIQPQTPADGGVRGDDDDIGDGEDRGAMVAHGGHDSDYYYYYPWGGYDRDLGTQEEPPFGFNPYAVDVCESLFGYWPCLHRTQQRQNCGPPEAEEAGPDDGNELRFAADYVFGDSRYGEFGNYVHSSWL